MLQPQAERPKHRAGVEFVASGRPSLWVANEQLGGHPIIRNVSANLCAKSVDFALRNPPHPKAMRRQIAARLSGGRAQNLHY
jgi:hypothetical protein